MAKFKVGDKVHVHPNVDPSRAIPNSKTTVRMSDGSGRYILTDGSNVYEDEIQKR